MNIDLDNLITEKRNENSQNIDKLSTLEMLKIINNEDKTVPFAVEHELDKIAFALDKIYNKVRDGGRLIYCGAGSSGRLGVLDAVECPPTYSVSNNCVIGIIAGGYDAMFEAKEGAEDSLELCEKDLKDLDFCQKDVLVGMAASGRTPYVIGGLKYAKSMGSLTIAITCNPESEISIIADVAISPIVGPEVVTGSTRMKAGTAQKLVLNMISTGLMIKLGKVYENLMVDVKPTNKKLIERAKRIVLAATNVSYEESEKMLSAADYNPKLAILTILTKLDIDTARRILKECDGRISHAIEHSTGSDHIEKA